MEHDETVTKVSHAHKHLFGISLHKTLQFRGSYKMRKCESEHV